MLCNIISSNERMVATLEYLLASFDCVNKSSVLYKFWYHPYIQKESRT
jgi:hypothetical protein